MVLKSWLIGGANGGAEMRKFCGVGGARIFLRGCMRGSPKQAGLSRTHLAGSLGISRPSLS